MKKNTTKTVAVMLSFSMILGLVACGNNQAAKVKDDVSNSALLNEKSVKSITKGSNEQLESVMNEDNDSFINLNADTSLNSSIEIDTDAKTELEIGTGEAIVNSESKKEVEQTIVKTELEKEFEESIVKAESEKEDGEAIVKQESEEKVDETTTIIKNTPNGEYKKGVVLVKVKDTIKESLFGELEYNSVNVLYEGSKWYSVELTEVDKTEEAVNYLTEFGNFEKVDYDYVMGVTADVESVDVSCNPNYDNHKHHHTHKIPEGWKHIKKKGKHPGGSSDVVVAVIDTGVDYNHLDLRNNIWKNSAEIADNGKDDDGNGYIDDVYGWDCVGNDKDPMDDNGHGTHVAGIIAAENNEIGGVGIAYNCKIMVIKAGNSSGYFNNSDIAEAIQYAYMNGASVINMSFGGSNISIAVEEALENAYNSCILVAAAGNESACNDIDCKTCDLVKVSYPAALPYVIGVMSTNADGSMVSSFSNYDHNPYNSIEYEVYAVGESISSTWPGNKYASLNGTSMAAPTVSAIAALLRSAYTDRNVYSTKFIQSQIVNTGTIHPNNFIIEKTDEAHSVTNVYEALTQIPKPEVNLYDYLINDSTTISSKNNGNGVIDAGEKIHLSISLHNRGGIATNVNASIDTKRGEGLTDPYFTFVNDTIKLSDIGTYSLRESGDEKYFEIIVSEDCPNDYRVDFNIHFTYENGMDEEDTTIYKDDGRQKAEFFVSSGYYLPSQITEDTVYKADRRYIVADNVVIPEGVTVTFEEGCEIQFYDDREYYDSPVIEVYGTLDFKGSKSNRIKIQPSEKLSTYVCRMNVAYNGSISIEYADTVNLYVYDPQITETKSSVLNSNICYKAAKEFIAGSTSGLWMDFNVDYFTNNYIKCDVVGVNLTAGSGSEGNYIYASCGNTIYLVRPKNNIICANKAQSINTSLEANNNKFMYNGTKELSSLPRMAFYGTVTNNYFATIYREYASQIINNYYDSKGNTKVDVYGSCSDISKLWPHVVNVEMFNKDGESITTIGHEEVKVRVTFNRPMDTTKNTFLSFGTIEPYADYRIEGEYISDTVWEGTYTLRAQIENGQNFLKVNNACASDDENKKVFGEYQLHEFTIDTTAAMSMNLQAVETDNGIELTWAQDDYDTLMGYNIYRSDSKDGNYVKLNPAILLSTDESFLDDNVEPAKTYWYTFTVVLSDFTESAPAGKIMATSKDTLKPSLYHTPVNQGYKNNNLVISCTASDNVGITNVSLYYRTIGNSKWNKLSMSKQNDKYSATIYGSELTLAGVEYYIIATDGVNNVSKGSENTPYTIVVKEASSLDKLGDVDGNGSITTKDALMLMQCLNGDLLLADDEFKRADLNKDGVLSSAEALRILQYINGKVTSLEM